MGGTPRSQRYSFCALTVCCFVYTCVYSCVPTCTLLYTRVYTEALITTSFRGVCRLYEWALLGSPEGLVSARRMDTSQLYKWARTSTMDSCCSSLWWAPLVIVTVSLIMYPRARVAEISVVIWNYGRKCTTFADANPSEGVQSRRDERGGRE